MVKTNNGRYQEVIVLKYGTWRGQNPIRDMGTVVSSENRVIYSADMVFMLSASCVHASCLNLPFEAGTQKPYVSICVLLFHKSDLNIHKTSIKNIFSWWSKSEVLYYTLRFISKHNFKHTSSIRTKSHMFEQSVAHPEDEVSWLVIHMQGLFWIVLSFMVHMKHIYIQNNWWNVYSMRVIEENEAMAFAKLGVCGFTHKPTSSIGYF